MRSLLFIVAASLVSASTARPCAAPPPMRSVLTLVTAPGATLPADGAILVSRREVYAKNDEADEHWKLRDGQGHELVFTTEDLGSSTERWIPASAADRDLLIINEAGKTIATLHQTKAKAGSLAAPKATSLTATASLADARAMQMGVLGSSMTLVLGGDPPADALYLAIAITGSGARAHSAIEPKPHQRRFEATAYPHKSCSRGGPMPLYAGEHVALSWVDALGRRSAAVQITATKQR